MFASPILHRWYLPFARALRVAGVLQRVNLVLPVVVGGKRLGIPVLGARVVPLDSEPWMGDVLGLLLPLVTGRFIDVGVNLGQTLIKLRVLDGDRAYVGFEPNPVCVSYVRELVRVNRFENVSIVPTGLYTQDDVLELQLFRDTDTNASASVIPDVRPGQPVRSRQHVPVVRWETALRSIGDVPTGVVKIDVEGAELEVLTTMQPLLERDRPVILAEVLPTYGPENPVHAARVQRQGEIQRLLHRHDYAIYRIEKTAEARFSGLRQLQEIGFHGEIPLSDYLFAPASDSRIRTLPTV